MPWYRRKALWISVITLAATLTERYYGLPLSDETRAALLTLINVLLQALSGATSDAPALDTMNWMG